jgi:GntR family transcriptional regulator, transcriptional repressor for pyruvate dehydrogenase complex
MALLVISPERTIPHELFREPTGRAVTQPHCIPIEPHLETRADKMAEVVARRIAADIIERGLAPGDTLDSEQALLERLAVSRESLREGLRLLEVAGLVTIRRGPGGGTFVGSVDPTNLGRFAGLYYHMSGASYGELFEAYALADSLLAELAARHPGRAERRAAMDPFLDEAHSEPDLEHYMIHHAGFHAAVARLAGNRVVQITLHSVGLLVARHYVALADRRSLTLASARASRPFVEHDHAMIARAIGSGNHRRARALMEDHVRHIVAVLEADGLDPDGIIGWV